MTARSVLTQAKLKKLLKLMQLDLRSWQIRAVVSADNEGIYALSGPRQCGKSYFSCVSAIADASRGYRVLYTAHRLDTVNKMRDEITAWIKPFIAMGLAEVNFNSGVNVITFWNGGLILFRTRSSQNVAVGMTFDSIVWDEAQFLSYEQYEKTSPVLTVSEVRKEIFIGTPPTDEDLIRIHGIVAGPFVKMKLDGSKKYHEFSAAESYSLDIEINEKSCRRANPSAGSIPSFWSSMKSFSEKMSHKSFCRQYLGVWVLPEKIVQTEPELTKEAVESMLTSKASVATKFQATVGMNPQSDTAFIALNDGVTVEVAARIDVSMGDLSGVEEWLLKRVRTISLIRIPENSRGKALQSMLQAKRLNSKIKMIGWAEHSSQIHRFMKQTKEGSLKVYKATDTEIALSSFWLSVDSKSGGAVVNAAIPEDVALILSLVNSSIDKPLTERLAKPMDNPVPKRKLAW